MFTKVFTINKPHELHHLLAASGYRAERNQTDLIMRGIVWGIMLGFCSRSRPLNLPHPWEEPFQMKDSQAQGALISPLPASLLSRIILEALCTERYARGGERTGADHPLLPDLLNTMKTSPGKSVMIRLLFAGYKTGEELHERNSSPVSG